MRFGRAWLLMFISLAESGCGLGVSQLPEVWDRADSLATAHMELQIKTAIFCELRAGAIEARRLNWGQRYTYRNRNVTSAADIPLPDTWGAQVTLTLTADEKGSLTPSVLFKDPIAPARSFGTSVAQSFTLGLGGTLSSEGIRYDKYTFYYTAHDLIENAGPDDICHVRPAILGAPSTSSPFVDGRYLGIREWLPQAVAVTDFQRSSRASATGEGAPLGSSGSFTSDAITYDNKFVIVSEGSFTPTWNLLRIGTGTTPLLDLNRTRNHEILITIGPGTATTTVDKKTGKAKLVNTGPSSAAINAHLASEIGSAVANAIGPAATVMPRF
jgi:hypothetical protein